jgi:hypothetical protein
MSNCIVNHHESECVDLHTLEHIVPETTFYTVEWPVIQQRLGERSLESLKVHTYVIQDNKDRPVYVLETLPDTPILLEEKYRDAYIFTKGETPALFYIDHQAPNPPQPLIIDPKFHDRLQQLLTEIPAGDTPIAPEPNSNPSRLRKLQQIIATHPGHSRYLSLKRQGEPVSIGHDNSEHLINHVKPTTDDYKERQQKWHKAQTARALWDRVLPRLCIFAQQEKILEQHKPALEITPSEDLRSLTP